MSGTDCNVFDPALPLLDLSECVSVLDDDHLKQQHLVSDAASSWIDVIFLTFTMAVASSYASTSSTDPNLTLVVYGA